MAQQINNAIELQVVAVFRDCNNNNMQTERFTNLVTVNNAEDRAAYLAGAIQALENATNYHN